MADWTERLNRFIDSLQADRRPERSLASSREELDELRMAARLAGSRSENPSPDPEFLNRLRAQLSVGPSPVSRRFSRAHFLRAAGIWVAGLASGIGIDVAVRHFRPLTGATATLPVGRKLAGGTWFSVGPLTQLTDQSVIPFDAGAVPAFVLRDGQSVRALSRVCTHMGCLLNYNAPERELGCPCHGAVFDLNGQVNPGYDVMSLPPLPSIDVRVEKGTVYVLGA